MNKTLINILTFISGMTIMGIEMAASRLIAPYFGASIFVWSALISSVMLFLSLGYYFGGKIADKYPHFDSLCYVILLAGIITGIIPFLLKYLLVFSLNSFESNSYLILIVILSASLILISIPITLLAMVSPFVIRINMDKTNEAGNISGKIFTVSTIGSLFGTFLPVIFLIPNIGTQKTFILFAVILSVISSVGLFISKKNMFVFLIPVLIFFSFFIAVSKIKPDNRAIFEGESIYNFIHVIESNTGERELRLEEGYGIHSRYNPDKFLSNDIWSYFAYAPFFTEMNNSSAASEKRLLVIGLGAGTASKIFCRYYPDYLIDGVEIDPMIVEVGKKYFAMDEKNLNIYTDDGRIFLNKTTNFYDVIVLDAYRLPYIPFHLTTKEFFSEINKKLKQNGVFVVNIGRTIDDYRLVDAICKTLKTINNQVFTFDIPGQSMNTVAFAVKEKIDIEKLKKHILLKQHNDFKLLTQNIIFGIQEYNKETDMPIITDDCAPVEKIIDNIVIDYVLKNMRQKT
ncbi:fused MFS/spermidine synthase [Candidatus Poribacteria bacterium]|nr:fused MFS/spermidine synthase [Candidatus Poribacteria bacterium]